MNKILIISNAFYPENSPRSHRATELASELVRQGQEVTIITHRRIGTEDFCISHGIKFKDLGTLSWPVPKVKGNGFIKLFWRIITRLSILLFEYPMIQLIPLVKKALKGEKGYDLMISIAVPYPIHWGVSLSRSDKNKIANIWVADCGDPYMGQENDTFKPPFYFAFFEKKFCKKADYISIPTAASINGYYPEFHSKIKIIPQGFRFEDIQLNLEPRLSDKVIFAYGGMFIPERRDPSELLQFLNTLDSSYDFEFHIYTSTPSLVEPYIADSKGRIILKEVVDRKTLLYEMSSMDFVINFENVGNTQTPSKLIDYVIINKPILSVKFGNLKPDVVKAFLNKNYEDALVISNTQQYRIENVAKEFINLIGT